MTEEICKHEKKDKYNKKNCFLDVGIEFGVEQFVFEF